MLNIKGEFFMEFISDPEMRISKISNEGNGLFDFIIHGT